MGDLLRFIASVVFGWQWVVLIDFDEQRYVRRMRWRGRRPFAVRVGFNIYRVWLNADGTTSSHHASYTKRWEPYINFERPSPHEFRTTALPPGGKP